MKDIVMGHCRLIPFLLPLLLLLPLPRPRMDPPGKQHGDVFPTSSSFSTELLYSFPSSVLVTPSQLQFKVSASRYTGSTSLLSLLLAVILPLAVFSSPLSMVEDYAQALVIDNGSDTIKAGFAEVMHLALSSLVSSAVPKKKRLNSWSR